MNAPPKLHPNDQTLSSFGLGKLDDSSAEAVNTHLEQCPECRKRVAELPADSFLERVRDAQRAVHSRFGRSEPGGQSHRFMHTPQPAPAQHTTAGPRRTSRLRNPSRAGPRRHGRGLPGPEQAHGAQRGAQGGERTAHQPPGRDGPLPAGDPLGRQTAPSQHRHGVFSPARRRVHRICHGVRRGL